jgi:hypothetical protein
MNIGNKVIRGLQTPKIAANFKTYHYLYSMHLNIFLWDGPLGFTRVSKVPIVQKKSLRTPALYYLSVLLIP